MKLTGGERERKQKMNEEKTDTADCICVDIILSASYFLVVFNRNVIIDENHKSYILFVLY